MRILVLILALAACTPSPPPAPELPDTAPLTQAVQAWRAAPGPDTTQAVAELAGTLGEHPIGDAQVDVPLGAALCDVLLRPDLGRPRLAPHAQDLEGDAADAWLDCLLRAGDLPTLAQEVQRLQGRVLDVEVDALEAAAVQSRAHHEITWRQAVRAHDAGAIADAQHPRGRALDRPVPQLAAAFRVLHHVFPDSQVHAVVTRSARTDGDDPLVDPGVMPTTGGRRRVLGYATTPQEQDALAARVRGKDLSRVVGLAVEVRDDAGRAQVRLCAEGHKQGDQIWLLTACDTERELAWLQATERFLDLQVAGQTEAQAGAQVREAFAEKLR